MSRSSLFLAGAAALLLLVPSAEAQRVKTGARVRQAPAKHSKVRTRHQVRPNKRVRLTKKRSRLVKKNKLMAGKNRLSKRAYRSRIKTRRTRLAIKHLKPADRKRVMKLLSSKRLRNNPQARSLVAQYLKLHAKTGGKNMPISLKTLEGIATSKKWSPKSMSNLSKVLRLANYYAKTGKLSPKAAFIKAMKKAGVYKKYKSGTCKV